MAADNPPDATLIEAHRNAQRKLAKARRVAVLVPLALVLALIAYLAWKAHDFCHTQAPLVLKKVMQRAPEVVGPALGEASAAFGRLAPVYSKAIQDAFLRDKPIYDKLVASQSQAFVEYATRKQALLNTRFNVLAGKILANVENQLVPNLVGGERVAFEAGVARGIYNRLEREIDANWSIQIKQVQDISQNIYKIALESPDAQDKNPRYIVGVGLELLGLKLEAAK